MSNYTKSESQICAYVLERAKSIDLERYTPYVDLLRRFFVPSIDHRALILLEHFVYDTKDSKCRQNELDFCLALRTKIEPWFESDGLAGIFLDSIMLSSRLDKIGCELENADCQIPEIRLDMPRTCDLYGSIDQWIRRYYQSTFLDCSSTSAVKNTTNSCLKSKAQTLEASNASYSDENQSKSSHSSSIFSDSLVDGTKCTGDLQPRNNKLKLIVNEVCPVGCPGRGRRRRIVCLKLPCEPKALEEKVCKGSRLPSLERSRKSDKWNDRLKNVCICLNNVVKRMDDETLNQSSLSCIVRKDYIRFKLEHIKSRLCMFTTKMSTKQTYRRDSEKKKNSYQCTRKNELDLLQQRTCEKNHLDEKVDSELIDRPTNSKVVSKHSNGCLKNTNEPAAPEQTDSLDSAELFSPVWKNKSNFTPCDCSEGAKDDIEVVSKCDRKLRQNIEHLRSEIEELCCNVTPREYSSLCECKRKQFREVGVCTDKVHENKVWPVIRQNVTESIGTCTEADDAVELTNIYINEISFCGCKDAAVNTDLVEKVYKSGKARRNAGVNTMRVNYKENSTQIKFDDTRYSIHNRSLCNEYEIENVTYVKRDEDPSRSCNKLINTEEKLSFEQMSNESLKTTYDNSELTRAMVAKIDEISTLNEKIRKKITRTTEKKNVCSLSVKTSNSKKLIEDTHVQIEVINSVISIKSITTQCKNSTPENVCIIKNRVIDGTKVCRSSTCPFKTSHVSNPTLKKSILTEVGASFQRSYRQRPRKPQIIQKVVSENDSILVQSRPTCRDNLYSRGDSAWRDSEPPTPPDFCEKCDYLHKPCKCSRKSYLLRYLSEHLTRETFEKCKRMLRCVLRKILERARALAELRNRRKRRCCYCHRYSGSFREKRSCCNREERIAAGSDPRTFGTNKRRFPDLENPWGRQRLTRRGKTRQEYRQRLGKVRSSPEHTELEERNRRIEAFVARWNKPCNVYKASNASLPLSSH